MERKEDQNKTGNNFEYMEELSKAYREAFAKRLIQRQTTLPEEKRDAICKMQTELTHIVEVLSRTMHSEIRKELAAMARESAEEFLRLLSDGKEQVRTPGSMPNLPLTAVLPRATLLANRSLNLLVRHSEPPDRMIFLILSELSALYALAAIS